MEGRGGGRCLVEWEMIGERVRDVYFEGGLQWKYVRPHGSMYAWPRRFDVVVCVRAQRQEVAGERETGV